MRYIFFILISFSMCFFVNAQDEKKQTPNKGLRFQTEYEKECGSPFVESQLYDSRKGKITKIISGNTVIFEQAINNGNRKRGTFTVQLAGIDSESNEEYLKAFLRKTF